LIDRDLERLLRNMADDQIEMMVGIAIRLATAKTESFTGRISFEVNLNQGTAGDMHVNKAEVVRMKRNRGVRSGGL